MKRVIAIVGIVMVSGCSGYNESGYKIYKTEEIIPEVTEYFAENIRFRVSHIHWYDSIGKFKVGDTVYISAKR